MRKTIIKLLCIACGAFIATSCGDKHKEAKQYIQNIREVYESGDYETAKQRIDSIQILYPKSFDQIKEALALLQDVRRAQDTKQVEFCDSAIAVLQPKIDAAKQSFVYDRNKEYEEKGRYLPKATYSTVLTGTLLRSGVEEDGTLFLESVYVGGQMHDKLKVSTKDGSFAETLPVNDEGMNFRFTDMGKQYETIKFAKDNENGVAKFIFTYSDKPLTVTLKGKNTTSYPLSNIAKKAIGNSLQLSSLILEMDSLKNLKETTLVKIKYIDSKKTGQQQ